MNQMLEWEVNCQAAHPPSCLFIAMTNLDHDRERFESNADSPSNASGSPARLGEMRENKPRVLDRRSYLWGRTWRCLSIRGSVPHVEMDGKSTPRTCSENVDSKNESGICDLSC